MLIDAGAASDGIPESNPHPNASRSAGAWIARYPARRRVNASDYAVITHFHPDHMGAFSMSAPLAPSGNYRLTGITEVGTIIPIKTLLDRAHPDYSYPSPLKDDTLTNYARFFRAQKGMTTARFGAGSSKQIALRKDPSAYPQFEIRNIIANGEVWSGIGDSVRYIFPPTYEPSLG